ncbi:hypothetical protein [Sphingomonas guangdongensis]|uniref:hypothetical protein n=1 Tax=Sphingomonas guangdongensis TaxID=1141890 RepID=UPI0011818246|nr:hypothetical protein [Sphingomonas guangdongensis]
MKDHDGINDRASSCNFHDATGVSDLLALHGIWRTTVDVFHYGAYRYNSAVDALAKALRHPVAGHV